jgi:ABC-type nitrate/sulfonate/bicarbonate transport system substrate-binding protein
LRLYSNPTLSDLPLADLKGKKIAVTGLGSTADYAARAIVGHYKLDPDRDVSLSA